MDLPSLDLPFIGDKTWNRVERYLDVRPNRRPRHKDGHFHASGLQRMCPVLEYWTRTWAVEVKKAKGKKKTELQELLRAAQYVNKFPGSTEAILDLGTMIHKQIQFYYGIVGLLVGAWKCPVCGHVVEDDDPIQMPRLRVPASTGHGIYDFKLCPECKKNHTTWPHWEYVEPHAVDKAEWISGSTDGFLDYKFDGRVYKGILEVKSINEAGFLGKYDKDDPLPKRAHVYQASIYMHLFGRGWALILYYNKNKSHVKEFLVPKDPEVWDRAVGKTRAIRNAIKGKKPPADDWRACRRIKDPNARTCPAAVKCWGRKPPENFMAS